MKVGAHEQQRSHWHFHFIMLHACISCTPFPGRQAVAVSDVAKSHPHDKAGATEDDVEYAVRALLGERMNDLRGGNDEWGDAGVWHNAEGPSPGA